MKSLIIILVTIICAYAKPRESYYNSIGNEVTARNLEEMPIKDNRHLTFHIHMLHGDKVLNLPVQDVWKHLNLESASDLVTQGDKVLTKRQVPCEEVECHNGLCTQGRDDSTPKCLCYDGFVGAKCERLRLECSDNKWKCQNGECENHHGTHMCRCDKDLVGLDCKNNVVANPCGKQSEISTVHSIRGFGPLMPNLFAHCLSNGTFLARKCPRNLFWDQEAETCVRERPRVPTGMCATYPCANGGRCEENGNEYSCYCTSGFFGKDCTQKLDMCSLNPCHGGRCRSWSGGYTCECPEKVYDKCCCNGVVNKCRRGLDFYPHNATSFVHCGPSGEAYLKSCPSGLIWQNSIKTCVRPDSYAHYTNLWDYRYRDDYQNKVQDSNRYHQFSKQNKGLKVSSENNDKYESGKIVQSSNDNSESVYQEKYNDNLKHDIKTEDYIGNSEDINNNNIETFHLDGQSNPRQTYKSEDVPAKEEYDTYDNYINSGLYESKEGQRIENRHYSNAPLDQTVGKKPESIGFDQIPLTKLQSYIQVANKELPVGNEISISQKENTKNANLPLGTHIIPSRSQLDDTIPIASKMRTPYVQHIVVDDRVNYDHGGDFVKLKGNKYFVNKANAEVNIEPQTDNYGYSDQYNTIYKDAAPTYIKHAEIYGLKNEPTDQQKNPMIFVEKVSNLKNDENDKLPTTLIDDVRSHNNVNQKLPDYTKISKSSIGKYPDSSRPSCKSQQPIIHNLESHNCDDKIDRSLDYNKHFNKNLPSDASALKISTMPFHQSTNRHFPIDNGQIDFQLEHMTPNKPNINNVPNLNNEIDNSLQIPKLDDNLQSAIGDKVKEDNVIKSDQLVFPKYKENLPTNYFNVEQNAQYIDKRLKNGINSKQNNGQFGLDIRRIYNSVCKDCFDENFNSHNSKQNGVIKENSRLNSNAASDLDVNKHPLLNYPASDKNKLLFDEIAKPDTVQSISHDSNHHEEISDTYNKKTIKYPEIFRRYAGDDVMPAEEGFKSVQIAEAPVSHLVSKNTIPVKFIEYHY